MLLFVAAIGAVGYMAQQRVRAMAVGELTASRETAVRLLADMLPTSDDADECRRTLQRFTAAYGCAGLRIYDGKKQIAASADAGEVGRLLPTDVPDFPITPSELQSQIVAADAPQIVVRTPVHGVMGAPRHYLEVVFDMPALAGLAAPLPSWALGIAAVAAVALLLIYHQLRRRLGSAARISENLVHNADHLRGQLEDLRIQDEADELTTCWNRLVDLTIELDEEVARSAAASELLAALNRSEGGELADALVSAPVGVILCTEQGEVSYANAMAQRVVGWSGAEDTDLRLDDASLSNDGNKIVEAIRLTLDNHAAGRPLVRQIEGEDDSYYNLQIVPVRTAQQSHRTIALILDVSQQVRADKAREEFVSQVTHELRTPLTNIRAYAETLSSGMFDDPQVITECYNVITKETRRLSRLIEDILSISQLEVGTMQLVVDDVDLRPLLTEAARDVRGIAESKNIDLQLVLPPKLSPIRADRDKLAVVVNNLLGNALKYTPADGQVTLSCKTTDTQVQIAVRDTGIGIDPKDHGRVFEKFQRADDAAVQAETGTGIGLTTAREIVQQHGGEITLVSRKGEGSTFTVSLPVAKRVRGAAEAAVKTP